MKNKKSIFSKIKESRFLKVMFARKSVVFCTIILLLLLLSSVFAPLIAPYDPLKQDLRSSLAGVSPEHIFGTDEIGRDIFSRILYGGRISFAVGFGSVLFAAVGGIVLGLFAAMMGGMVEIVIMRIMDAVSSIPGMVLAMFMSAIMGKGIINVCVSLGLCLLPQFCRVTRAQALLVRQSDYIIAGTLCGASQMVNTIKHVLPHCISLNIVTASMSIGAAIITEASLSFLGLGINPPAPSWGGMINAGYTYLSSNPIIAIVPGIFIMVVVLCANFVGDAVRDAMDPKLRGTLAKAGKKHKIVRKKATAQEGE